LVKGAKGIRNVSGRHNSGQGKKSTVQGKGNVRATYLNLLLGGPEASGIAVRAKGKGNYGTEERKKNLETRHSGGGGRQTVSRPKGNPTDMTEKVLSKRKNTMEHVGYTIA